MELIDNGEQTVLALLRAELGLLAGSEVFDGLLSRLDEEGGLVSSQVEPSSPPFAVQAMHPGGVVMMWAVGVMALGFVTFTGVGIRATSPASPGPEVDSEFLTAHQRHGHALASAGW